MVRPRRPVDRQWGARGTPALWRAGTHDKVDGLFVDLTVDRAVRTDEGEGKLDHVANEDRFFAFASQWVNRCEGGRRPTYKAGGFTFKVFRSRMNFARASRRIRKSNRSRSAFSVIDLTILDMISGLCFA